MMLSLGSWADVVTKLTSVTQGNMMVVYGSLLRATQKKKRPPLDWAKFHSPSAPCWEFPPPGGGLGS